MPVQATGLFLVKLPGANLDAAQLGGLPTTTTPLYPDETTPVVSRLLSRDFTDTMRPLNIL